MSRGLGELGPIQEQIPEWLAVVIALLTQLGDIWFLVLVVVSLYWFHASRRRHVAAVAGMALGGIGLYRGLKEIFGLPRPDQPLLDADLLPWIIQPLYESTAAASGYGFPSGHATNTTIVYIGLAGALAVATKRIRYATAAIIVATVCFTRLALGVHYLVDVVAGVALGLAFLATVRFLLERTDADGPTVTFGLAVVFGTFYLATSGADSEAIFLTGAALGSFAGWQAIRLGETLVEARVPSEAARPALVHLGLGALALAPLFATLEYYPLLSVYTGGSAIGFASAIVITVPVARHSSHVQHAATAIRFWLRMALLGVRFLCRPSTWRRIYQGIRGYLRRFLSWARAKRQGTS